MTLLNDLYQVYEDNIDDADALMPLSHMTTTAHIKVEISIDGDFERAYELPPKTSISLPCTIESAGRANGIVAHPLHDKLRYVAGDIENFGIKLRRTKQNQSSFDVYLSQLSEWASSEQSVPEVRAVYNYLKKRTLIQDLVNGGMLFLDDKGKLVDKWPGDSRDPHKNEIFSLVTGGQADAFIYFNVVGSVEMEKNEEVIHSWISYYQKYLSHNGKIGMDYVTGKQMGLTKNHARNIRYGGDGAKLISSNDTSGFTFRGRFEDAEQAATIGYETSDKAFDALKWLIRKQGYNVNGRVFVTWGDQDPNVPQATNAFDEPIEITDTTDTNFAKMVFQKYLKGWNTNLKTDRLVHILVIDAATPGRMDVVYYQSLDSKLYLNRLEQWFEKMSIQVVKNGRRQLKTISLSQLTRAAFGERTSDELMAETVLRLVRCVTDNQRKIPIDLAKQILIRAGKPLASSEQNAQWSWWNAVEAAVAVNQKNDNGKEGLSLGLDINNKDRSYLFGRLLATADRVEAEALQKNTPGDHKGRVRPTAAMRYMNAFEQHPDTTWKVIHRTLLPYLIRNEYSNRYEKIFGEIYDKLDPNDNNNQPLNSNYINGFYHQSRAFFLKPESDQQEDNK